jgi:hypothetical protein
MDDQKGAPQGWSNVVSEASRHVKERRAAIEEAQERQKPKSRAPILAAVVAVLVAVVAWDVYVFTRPPELPTPEREAANLRWFVGDAVNLIEDYRAETGRLPTRADLGDLLDDEIVYEIQGEGYVVIMEGERASVEYESGVPLEDWMAFGDREGGPP